MNTTIKKRSRYSPLRFFDWIDSHPSETTRRVIQGVITTIVSTAFLGTGAFIWTHGSWFASGSNFILQFLKSPIQLQIWVIVLIAITAFWFSYFFRREKSEKTFIAEIKTLQNQITEHTKQDLPFMEVIRYIIDENRAKGLKYIIEYTIGDIDKAVPMIRNSKTFDDFLAKAGIILNVDDSLSYGVIVPQMKGQMSFGVPSRDNPLLDLRANILIDKKNSIRMNQAAHMYYDWSYITFKKKFEVEFRIQEERGENRQKIQEEKLQFIPMLQRIISDAEKHSAPNSVRTYWYQRLEPCVLRFRQFLSNDNKTKFDEAWSDFKNITETEMAGSSRTGVFDEGKAQQLQELQRIRAILISPIKVMLDCVEKA